MEHLRDPGFSRSTFYGQVAFDANMQNKAQSSVVQHDSAGVARVVWPLRVQTGEVQFPAPTWGYRACKKTHNCGLPGRSNGVCQNDATCVCTDPEYEGSTCSTKIVPLGLEFYLAVTLSSLIGFALLVRLAWWIYLRWLRSKPLVMISYRHLDKDFAFKMQASLLKSGFRVWIDTAITPGSDWRQDIASAIKDSIAVVFVVSPGAVTSKYCKEELYYASALSKPIFPVVHIDAFKDLKGGVQTILQRIQWIPCQDDFEAGYAKLAKELKKLDDLKTQLNLKRKTAKVATSDDKWVTADDTSETGKVVISEDVYICHHPADTTFAAQIQKSLLQQNVKSTLARRAGSSDARAVVSASAETSPKRAPRLLPPVSFGQLLPPAAGAQSTENQFELNTTALQSAHAFCFIMSQASLADDTCGEEFHAAYELDKQLVLVTPGKASQIPAMMGERGSMSMMIEAKMKEVVSFGDTAPDAARSMTIGAVFHAVAASYKSQQEAGASAESTTSHI
jgi:hypothetical protein